MSDIAIGIDLGTTNCCVAVLRDGAVEIIPNENGNRTTPSFVSYDISGDDISGNMIKGRYIGEAAKNRALVYPENTIFESKRLIGRGFNDPVISNEMANMPYKIVEGKNGNCVIRIGSGGGGDGITPEEVGAALLSQLKKDAERYLGCAVTKAVITVPAYFNDTQRQATKDAGRIAGLDVLRIINEPTAASLAYGLGAGVRGRGETHETAGAGAGEAEEDPEKHILVFDCGGGTQDVSLLTLCEGVFEVRATSGDTHLGGGDIDSIIMDYAITAFKRKYLNTGADTDNDVDIAFSNRTMNRLRIAAVTAKHILSNASTTRIQVDNFYDGIDLDIPLSRAKFEDLCHEFFRRLMIPVENVFRDSEICAEEIDDIVLVGGTTRIPAIRNRLRSYFGGDKELCMSVNPDEAVAYGAAVQAAILTGQDRKTTGDILLMDVIPLSLGIETAGGIMNKIIKRNTTIPTRETQVFSTYMDNQESVTIQIYQGERSFTEDCVKLGEFILEGIPPLPRAVPRIHVEYKVDANGILNVKASYEGDGPAIQNELTIHMNENTNLSNEDIEAMIQEGKRYKTQDARREASVLARNELENYCHSVRKVSSVAEEIDAVFAWLEEHDDPEKYDADIYIQKKRYLERSIVNKN
jgi:heat shock protein 1/8